MRLRLKPDPVVPFHDRRRRVTALMAIAAATVGGLHGCMQEKQLSAADPISDEDVALRHKFRGLSGGELRVDAMVETSKSVIYKPDGTLFAGLFGVFSPTKSIGTGYFGDENSANSFGVPKTLRMVRYPDNAKYNIDWEGRNISEAGRFFGDPVVDVTAPVASRIPIEALDRVRQYKGSLTLKLRLTPNTLLIGWEVKNGKGYPYKRDKNGDDINVWEDFMIGGDFCERQVRNLRVDGKHKLVETKGWYIDPQTQKKIELDF